MGRLRHLRVFVSFAAHGVFLPSRCITALRDSMTTDLRPQALYYNTFPTIHAYSYLYHCPHPRITVIRRQRTMSLYSIQVRPAQLHISKLSAIRTGPTTSHSSAVSTFMVPRDLAGRLHNMLAYKSKLFPPGCGP